MAKNLKIEIEETTSDENRNITVTISAGAQEFLLADLLRQRGAIAGLEAPLKAAVRETVQGYLESAEELIAGIAEVKKKGGNGAKPRTSRRAEESEADDTTEARQGANGDVLSL
jgi:hypothetical protein